MPGIMSGLEPMKLKDGGFPDLSGDGQITQKDILIGKGVIKKKNGGIASFQEGGDAGQKYFGAGEDYFFDYTNPLDLAMIVPGLGTAGLLARGTYGLGRKALTSAPVQKALEQAFRSLGKVSKRTTGPKRDQGRILSDVAQGKKVAGTIGKGVGLTAVPPIIGEAIKAFPEGEETSETEEQKEEKKVIQVKAPDVQKGFFETLRDAPGELFKKLQDDPAFRDRFLAGSIKMTESTPGIVPTTGTGQFYKGFKEEEKAQTAKKLAELQLAAQLKKAQGKSVLENVLSGTSELQDLKLLAPAISDVLYGGATDLIATPAGAEFMGIEVGSPITGSMMTTLIQQLQSQGLSGSSLEEAIKTAVQPNIQSE